MNATIAHKVEGLFVDEQLLEVPSEEALQGKTVGDSDTYTEED